MSRRRRRHSEVLRATFLQHFEDNGDAEKLVEAAEVIYRALLEAAPSVPEGKSGSAIVAELRAALIDLRVDEKQLREIGRGRRAHSLSPPDAELATLAGKCAKELRGVIGEIEHALDHHWLRLTAQAKGRQGADGSK
jgi:predicted nucleic acid-binding protein